MPCVGMCGAGARCTVTAMCVCVQRSVPFLCGVSMAMRSTRARRHAVYLPWTYQHTDCELCTAELCASVGPVLLLLVMFSLLSLLGGCVSAAFLLALRVSVRQTHRTIIYIFPCARKSPQCITRCSARHLRTVRFYVYVIQRFLSPTTVCVCVHVMCNVCVCLCFFMH